MRTFIRPATAGTAALALLAGCGVKISDDTPTALARNPASTYEFNADIETSGAVLDSVTVKVDGTPFPMALVGGGWRATVPVNPCVNSLAVRYEAVWHAGTLNDTEREPEAGSLRKWLTGAPAVACPDTFGKTFTVDSTADQPDASPGDGLCQTATGACTLRAAIMEANTTAVADRIVLASQTYALTRQGQDDDASTGDLDIRNPLLIETANGGTATIDAAGLGDRVFDLFPAATDRDGRADWDTVTLRDLVIRGGHPAGAGGGIYSRAQLFMERVVIRDNEAGSSLAHYGGGLYLANFAHAVEIHVRDNRSGHIGGGIYLAEGAKLVLERSSVTGNRNGAQHGGGIALMGGSLEATNVTISGNSSTTYGGGIYANGLGGSLLLRNVTIARNRADDDDSLSGSPGAFGGGVLLAGGSTSYTIGNTLIAENWRGSGATPSDCMGTINSRGYNLIEDMGPSCVLTGITTGNLSGLFTADLADLGYWGGFAPVHRLQTTSAARDAGNTATPNNASTLACPTIDQRNIERPRDGDGRDGARCDIGAVEM